MGEDHCTIFFDIIMYVGLIIILFICVLYYANKEKIKALFLFNCAKLPRSIKCFFFSL